MSQCSRLMTDDELRRHAQTHTPATSSGLYDARGIYLRRVCGECRESVMAQYAPEVLGLAGRYEDVVEEPIEPDDY